MSEVKQSSSGPTCINKTHSNELAHLTGLVSEAIPDKQVQAQFVNFFIGKFSEFRPTTSLNHMVNRSCLLAEAAITFTGLSQIPAIKMNASASVTFQYAISDVWKKSISELVLENHTMDAAKCVDMAFLHYNEMKATTSKIAGTVEAAPKEFPFEKAIIETRDWMRQVLARQDNRTSLPKLRALVN